MPREYGLLPLEDTDTELFSELEYLISDTECDDFQSEEVSHLSPWTKGALYCRKNTYPILRIVAFVSLLVVSCGVCIGLGCYTLLFLKPGLVIDKSYNAFTILNHKASEHYDSLIIAVKNNVSLSFRYRRSLSTNSISGTNNKENIQYYLLDQKKSRSIRSSDTVNFHQSHIEWKMQVIFLAKGDEQNIFTKERIETIHNVEQRIRSHHQYPNFCYRDFALILDDPAVKSYNGCAPLNSLLTYFYPSKDANGNLHYDGLGANMVDIDSAVDFAMTNKGFYYFVDEKASKSLRKSRLLRTEVFFGVPLKGYWSFSAQKAEQIELFKKFVITYIDTLSKESTQKVDVLFGGNEIFDYEVETTFWNDIRLAAYALGAVIFFILILSFSLWLMFWGTMSILLSFPLALFFYRVVFGIKALGILNGAAAFVIIGIGVDDVFVFINIFRQSSHLKTPVSKMIHTVKTAGKATFFTSFTTAAAFAANIGSAIPAIHQFGLFMSLIVSCCWVTVMLIMPPALYLWSVTFAGCEKYILSVLCCCIPCKKRLVTLPEDVLKFISGNQHTASSPSPQEAVNHSFSSNEDDFDVPMLAIDDDVMYADPQTDDDVPMLLPGPDNHQMEAPVNTTAASSNGVMLQALLYTYLALPVIKVRWIILGVSTVLLCVSIGLMTQLKPSSKPPQIFREDTNLQKLLDLKANLSMLDTLTCRTCSGIYYIDNEELRNTPAPATNIPVGRRTPAPPLPKTSTASHHYIAAVQNISKSTKPPKWTKKQELKTSVPPRLHVPITKPPPTYKPRTTKTIPKPLFTLDPTVPPKSHPPQSPPEDIDLCSNHNCQDIKDRPLMDSGASIYVVFGIKGIDRSEQNPNHVLEQFKGTTIFDKKFSTHFSKNSDPKVLKASFSKLCKICKIIASNTELVQNGSAACLPDGFLRSMPFLPDECRDLPVQQKVSNIQLQIHLKAVAGMTTDHNGLLWLTFAFESTTSKAMSYFEAYKDYLKWEKFIEHIKTTELEADSPLQSMFQTSEFWTKVMMEIVAVSSAIYGLVLSMVICIFAVAIFTGHIMLLVIVFITILKIICLVVGIFYISGWEMGGVEAVSLSILVGSSVDYCVHLVESYQMAGKALPGKLKKDSKKARQWRTSAAIAHIGVSVISSALTTVIAAIPLTQTTIQPFRKFGQILAFNAAVCILYALTVCSSLLSSVAPAFFSVTWKSTAKALVSTVTVVGLGILTIYVLSTQGIAVPGPNGEALFGH